MLKAEGVSVYEVNWPRDRQACLISNQIYLLEIANELRGRNRVAIGQTERDHLQ